MHEKRVWELTFVYAQIDAVTTTTLYQLKTLCNLNPISNKIGILFANELMYVWQSIDSARAYICF